MANPGAEMAAGPKKSGFFFPTLFSGVIIMGGARILGGPETRISGFWHPGGILTPGWRIWPWPGILAPDTVSGFGHMGILYRGLSCSLSGPWRMFVFLSNV